MTAAHAQNPARTAEFEDLGFTEPVEIGARASAMRTFAATADDATALVLNPAGLARIKRPQGEIAAAHQSSRLRLDYGRGPTGNAAGTTRLAFAGVAFPLRVLRGSLVPAVSVHRAFSSARDLVYARDNRTDGRSESFSLEQSGGTYAYSLGVGTDLSAAISAGLSLYALNGHVEALRQYHWQPLVTAPTEHTFVLENVTSDVGGYGARVGMRFYVHRRVQVGFRLDTPTVINVRSRVTREETRQIDNDVGSFVRVTSDETTEYIIPYRVDGAVALLMGPVRLTAQVGYSDWSTAAIDGRRVLTRQTDTTLESVVSLGSGLEWSPARLPLRLRAGFEHAPSPLKYLATDRIDNMDIDRVQSQSGRTRMAAGAALLLRSQFVVEAAWVHASGSRTTATLRDEYRATAFSVQGACYF